MPFHLISLGVMHGLICHLPAAARSSSVLLFPIHLPAFSLFCHHPSSHSALSRLPLCAEHSIFCLFSVSTSSVNRFLSFLKTDSPTWGLAHISAETLPDTWLCL